MSPLKHHDKLDALASEIRHLRAVLMELEREAFNVGTETTIERAAIARGRLDAALALYFEESETARTLVCPVHGPGVHIISCPDCVEAWGRKYGPGGRAA